MRHRLHTPPPTARAVRRDFRFWVYPNDPLRGDPTGTVPIVDGDTNQIVAYATTAEHANAIVATLNRATHTGPGEAVHRHG